jgi:hypothetical protein
LELLAFEPVQEVREGYVLVVLAGFALVPAQFRFADLQTPDVLSVVVGNAKRYPVIPEFRLDSLRLYTHLFPFSVVDSGAGKSIMDSRMQAEVERLRIASASGASSDS